MKLTEKELARIRKLPALKGRRESGLFMVEGVRCVGELINSDYGLEKLIVCESLLTETGRHFMRTYQGPETYELSARKFRQISSERSSQGLIAVARCQKHGPLRLRTPSLIILIQKMSDPANLGALIRSAAAFGAGLIIGSESVDIYSPKVISASSGFLFRAEIELCPTVLERINFLKENSFQIWGADCRGADFYAQKKIPERLALAIGNEAFGLPDDMRQKLDLRVRIPIKARVESLSAPIAGAILMQYLARQLGLVN